MKKFLVLIPIMVIILTACTTGALRKAQGEWESNSNEDLKLTIKDDEMTVNINGTEINFPDKIKKSDKYKDFLTINTSEDEDRIYFKVEDDNLLMFNDPEGNPRDILEKVK